MILRYVLYWPVNIVLVLLSYVLSPVLAGLSMAIGKSVLPGVLQWFSTTDNTLDGGINDHVAGYDPAAKGWRLWWQRTCWICRNPAHGWQSNILGISAEESVILQRERVPQLGSPLVKEWVLMEDKHGRRFFTSKRSVTISKRFYLKLWLGWQNNAYDGRNHHYLFNVGLKRR